MRQETEIKETQMGNGKVKLFIFANMILFIIDPQDATQRLNRQTNSANEDRIISIKNQYIFNKLIMNQLKKKQKNSIHNGLRKE